MTTCPNCGRDFRRPTDATIRCPYCGFREAPRRPGAALVDGKRPASGESVYEHKRIVSVRGDGWET